MGRLVALVVALCSPGSAQSLLHVFDGDSTGLGLGFAVAGAGDVDGDGHADLVLGSRVLAQVRSGADGSLLFELTGNGEFGKSVDGGGDVDGDGIPDVVVGAWFDDYLVYRGGSAQVFSGADGTLLHAFHGDTSEELLGCSVAMAGDVDRDGFEDLIVGARWNEHGGVVVGSAYVYSGRDGSTLYAFHGDSKWDAFGWSVAGAGDVDRDGTPDLIVGARYDDDVATSCGSARVFSGADGSVLYTFYGIEEEHYLGYRVAGAGDVDADGHADLVVGAWHNDAGVRVYSGASGVLLHSFPSESRFTAVAAAGDLDLDGFDDLIAGDARADGPVWQRSGCAQVVSGASGDRLFARYGPSEDAYYGNAVSGAGDVNGDGYPDLVVGAWNHDNKRGQVKVYSGRDVVGTAYCGPANLNSIGLSAELHARGSAAVADDSLHLDAILMPASQAGTFLASGTTAFVPFAGGSQGNLCLGGVIGRLRSSPVSNANGHFSLEVPLTNLPDPLPQAVQPGETWNFQAWYRDMNPGPTSNFTEAVSVTFF